MVQHLAGPIDEALRIQQGYQFRIAHVIPDELLVDDIRRRPSEAEVQMRKDFGF
jgi:hypothetical protein